MVLRPTSIGEQTTSFELIVDRRTAKGRPHHPASILGARAREPRGPDVHLEHSGEERGSEADTPMVG
jgi:hypothetical protein